MTTTDLMEEPPGPAPQPARSDDPQGGGPTSAPANGRNGPPQSSTAASATWASWATRAAAGLIGVLALAGIGTASLARGSDGVPFKEASSLLSGGSDRWLAALVPPSPTAPARPSHDRGGAATADAGTAAAESPSPSDSPPSDNSGGGITPDGRVVLNLANAEQLTHLPSIGPKRAEAIIALRTRLKRFKRPTDLLRVRGIGPKTLKRMLPHLVVDPPAAAATAGDAGADGGGK
jgi:competence protein ComEA